MSAAFFFCVCREEERRISQKRLPLKQNDLVLSTSLIELMLHGEKFLKMSNNKKNR
jgi:hypothetical protein